MDYRNAQGANPNADPRLEVCRALGIASVTVAYEIIVGGLTKGVDSLLQKRLVAANLIRLGYDAAGMRRLGYSDEALQRLGYPVGVPVKPVPAPEPRQPAGGPPKALDLDPNLPDGVKIQNLIAAGYRSSQLRDAGFTVHHCKKAGLSSLELSALGFSIHELAIVCSAAEMRRADFKPNELKNFYSAAEMRRAGFSAADMRLAGYGVRELINLGYLENHIRTAGFSTAEMLREGISKTTRG